ncbi:MAG: GDP-mannose 4,6-dehydratase [Deltaproteobacteria bacterium]
MTVRTALITGATGQDGTLLGEHLVGLGYRVVGVVRKDAATNPAGRVAGVDLVAADLCDHVVVRGLLDRWQPDEIYHLAAFHHSSEDHSAGASPVTSRQRTLATNFLATQALAFAVLESGAHPALVFAASSQMYTPAGPCDVISESTPRRPSTFYGHVKSWSTDLLAQLRADLGLRASTAILFNHESPLRGAQFVSRKITRAAAAIRSGRAAGLEVLNTRARVDWSSARDVVVALHRMAVSQTPGDHVVASGALHSVEDLLEVAFGHVGLDWRDHTTVRGAHSDNALQGDPRKLETDLGWRRAWTFENMIVEMVEHDLHSG